MDFLSQDLAQWKEEASAAKGTIEISWLRHFVIARNHQKSIYCKLTSSMISASPAENMRTGMSLSCELQTQANLVIYNLTWIPLFRKDKAQNLISKWQNFTSKNSKSSTTPSLKAIAELATDSLIASYVRPPSIRRLWVFPHLHWKNYYFSFPNYS